jgi:hypothetical protein
VRAAIAHDTQGLRRGTCRATRLDPYLPFIRDTLTQDPRLRATRLFEMVESRGYPGSVVQLRRWVRLIRPAATATVYRRASGNTVIVMLNRSFNGRAGAIATSRPQGARQSGRCRS